MRPILTSAYSDPENDPQQASQWQVSTGSGAAFDANIVYDSGPESDLTSHTVSIPLPTSTTVYWRVRHQDDTGDWSLYSDTTSFTTIGPLSGLLSYWQFEENTGTTVSDSFGSSNGTLVNGTWTANGIYGNAISFNGSTDYVEIPNYASLNITEAITLELWFKPSVNYNEALSNYVILLDRQWAAGTDAYFLGLNANGRLHFGSQGGNIQTTQASWTAGTWYHVVGTYRDVAGVRTGEFYVNGVLMPLAVNSYDNMVGGSQKIGIGGSDHFLKFNGIIDEVLIYNRTLTAGEARKRCENFMGEGNCQ